LSYQKHCAVIVAVGLVWSAWTATAQAASIISMMALCAHQLPGGKAAAALL
jgi:uncharacterized membrane protein